VIDEKVLARLKSCREFLVSEKIAAGIEEEFLLNVPESEIGYITMHLMGARNQLNDGAVNKFRLVCLARDLIKAAQELTGSRLVGNNKLLIDLVNHLSPAISRMKLKMEIRNPLLKEMKARYGSLMEMSRKAAAPLERELKLSFPEEEIAYLAMHIGAAMEEAAIKEKKKYRAVVACPTGIGSSRLLASRIKKEFARIEVVGTASVLNLDADALKRERVDFILSTTALNNAPLKAVQVSALLAESDRARIEKAIGELDENKASEDILDAAGDFKNSLARHINYGRAIYSLIENFFYLECGGESVAALIELVGDALREKGADKEKVKADLKGREAINSTVIDEPSIMLLHCETRGILTPHFGIIRAAGAIGGINNDMSNDVMAAAVMLLPKEHDGETAELMGHITEMLVENVSFSQSILFSSGDVCRREFTQGLRQFYITKNKLIMEEE
jgi:mannitol operon transcriptional antiterminator